MPSTHRIRRAIAAASAAQGFSLAVQLVVEHHVEGCFICGGWTKHNKRHYLFSNKDLLRPVPTALPLIVKGPWPKKHRGFVIRSVDSAILSDRPTNPHPPLIWFCESCQDIAYTYHRKRQFDCLPAFDLTTSPDQ